MSIDEFIVEKVEIHNKTGCDMIISKSYIAGRAWYFLYLKDCNTWSYREWSLYKCIYDKLSKQSIYPFVELREIDGKQKIGIAFEAKCKL